jgi:hypothetical protein
MSQYSPTFSGRDLAPCILKISILRTKRMSANNEGHASFQPRLQILEHPQGQSIEAKGEKSMSKNQGRASFSAAKWLPMRFKASIEDRCLKIQK